MKLTIFTPTYNRAYKLPELYESLTKQTNNNFVWLIVDDGSTDNTKELIENWINEQRISIKYYYQKNMGKMSAHNKGVELTETELFVCVDSDDMLAPEAVDEVIKCADTLTDEIGILAFKYDVSTKKNITFIDNKVESSTLKDGYDCHKLVGDTMLIYKSEFIKKYEFPSFKGEKFVPEAYLYDLLDREGKLRILRKSLYGVNYLDDGYTAGMARLLYNNPQGYFTYINQRLCLDANSKQRLSDSIRYIAMAIAHKKKRIIKNAVYPFWAAVAYIPGYIFYCKRYRGFRK
ncbi:MAG: glycosyltransferase family A protein [bacterium]|nr:glycosyltransferase family A protein [bacterium]